MITALIIKLNNADCEKIFYDLETPIGDSKGLSPETYLLYNKIKGMVCGYADKEVLK